MFEEKKLVSENLTYVLFGIENGGFSRKNNLTSTVSGSSRLIMAIFEKKSLTIEKIQL